MRRARGPSGQPGDGWRLGPTFSLWALYWPATTVNCMLTVSSDRQSCTLSYNFGLKCFSKAFIVAKDVWRLWRNRRNPSIRRIGTCMIRKAPGIRKDKRKYTRWRITGSICRTGGKFKLLFHAYQWHQLGYRETEDLKVKKKKKNELVSDLTLKIKYES